LQSVLFGFAMTTRCYDVIWRLSVALDVVSAIISIPIVENLIEGLVLIAARFAYFDRLRCARRPSNAHVIRAGAVFGN
jgi:hypothetical protein